MKENERRLNLVGRSYFWDTSEYHFISSHCKLKIYKHHNDGDNGEDDDDDDGDDGDDDDSS